MRLAVTTRARLTIYFTALFGAIMVSLAVAGYALARFDAYSKVDSQLRVAVDATAMFAEHELTEHDEKRGGEADLQIILSNSRGVAIPGTQILVREGARQVAYRKGANGSLDLRALDSAQLRTASINGLRVAHRGLVINKFQTSYQIYSATPVAPALARLETVRNALLIFVPLGLGLAALAGYLLARRTLAPLLELTRTIDSITSSDLSVRVPLHSGEDDIGRLALRFNSLLDRLEDAFSLQRRFMADASHELRTPITIALSAVQVTGRDAQRSLEDCNEALELVEQQMLKLRRIVEDMFFLSQADAAPLRMPRKEMYLDDAITEAARAVRTLARERRQSLVAQPLKEARCLGDQDLIKRAIVILLDNAVKYTPPDGTIEVSLEERGDRWICRVTDSGIGIPEAAQRLIFQRFYRAENQSVMKQPGAGLGLAIAQSIVESHGGELRLVCSRPGLTAFELGIPIYPGAAETAGVQANSLAVKI